MCPGDTSRPGTVVPHNHRVTWHSLVRQNPNRASLIALCLQIRQIWSTSIFVASQTMSLKRINNKKCDRNMI
jgi:hypothetical protein